MNRRGFLALLAATAAGLAIDPDLANWQPNQKTYILPPAEGWRAIHEAQREYNRLQSQMTDGISMRFVKEYDIKADEFPERLDVLYGVGTFRPELGVRLLK